MTCLYNTGGTQDENGTLGPKRMERKTKIIQARGPKIDCSRSTSTTITNNQINRIVNCKYFLKISSWMINFIILTYNSLNSMIETTVNDAYPQQFERASCNTVIL